MAILGLLVMSISFSETGFGVSYGRDGEMTGSHLIGV